MAKKYLFISVLFIIMLSFTVSWAEPVKIAGSGGMIKLVTELAKAYMGKNQGDVIEVKQESIEAKGGIMGAYKGDLDIGMAAQQLDNGQKKWGLKVFHIASTATVVTINTEVLKIDGIKSQQVCNIYEGKIKNWSALGGPDVQIMPFTRPDPDSTKVSVRNGIPCFADLIEIPEVLIMAKHKDMNNALMKNPYAIGFSDLESIEMSNGKLKALKLDGIAPSVDTVISGTWHIIKPFMLVTGKKQSATAEKFIQFIKTPAAQEIIKNNSAVPMKF
ncbi:MAG: substrate-binding domain-containing protein [Nitrospirae bacterium]|nr:substrate-binding domain-containing protein [Nitrospirota bacterium]